MEKVMELDLDEQGIKIKELYQALMIDSNPEELDLLKKVIKKNVPFRHRGYFLAYAVRELLKKSNKPSPRPAKKEIKKPQVNPVQEKEKEEEKPKKSVRVIPEGAKTLYINLGKIGRIYAKDLIDLICQDTDITKDDIFMIRVHDKYSFVTMSEENCNKAIEKLLGKVIKGRSVQINISTREKKESVNP